MLPIYRIAIFVLPVAALLMSGFMPALAGAPAPIPAITGPHPEHLVANLGEFRFENGDVVKDFKVSYITYGKLNKSKSNAILVMQYFLGDHHAYEYLIGPGKGLDPDKYFIVSADMLGNSGLTQGVTTGATNSGLKMDFPFFSIRDSVNVDYRLMKEYLGIDHVLAVAGASIGAMKSYQFAVSYPNYITAAIPIAGSPATSPMTRWFLNSMMDVIALDAGWQGGNYEINPLGGLAAASKIFVPYMYTEPWFVQNIRTPTQRRALEQGWHPYFVQDARDIYYHLRMWATFNLGDLPGFNGDTVAALKSIKARTLFLSMKGDHSLRNEEVAMVRNNIPGVVHVEVDAAGHSGCCGADPEASKMMNREIARFLSTLK